MYRIIFPCVAVLGEAVSKSLSLDIDLNRAGGSIKEEEQLEGMSSPERKKNGQDKPGMIQ